MAYHYTKGLLGMLTSINVMSAWVIGPQSHCEDVCSEQFRPKAEENYVFRGKLTTKGELIFIPSIFSLSRLF